MNYYFLCWFFINRRSILLSLNKYQMMIFKGAFRHSKKDQENKLHDSWIKLLVSGYKGNLLGAVSKSSKSSQPEKQYLLIMRKYNDRLIWPKAGFSIQILMWSRHIAFMNLFQIFWKFHPPDGPTNGLTNGVTDGSTDRATDQMTEWPTDQPTD